MKKSMTSNVSVKSDRETGPDLTWSCSVPVVAFAAKNKIEGTLQKLLLATLQVMSPGSRLELFLLDDPAHHRGQIHFEIGGITDSEVRSQLLNQWNDLIEHVEPSWMRTFFCLVLIPGSPGATARE